MKVKAGSGVKSVAQAYALGLKTGSVVRVLPGAGEAGSPERTATLGEFVARGNRGRIFSVKGDAWTCVKVFNTPTPVLGEKVREEARKLTSGEVSSRAAAWPRGLVVDPDGEVVGYVMDRLRGVPLSSIASDLSVGLPVRAEAAAGYARCLSELHGTLGTPPENTFVIGDVALSNAMVDRGRTGEARLIDVDSFQVAARCSGRRVLYPVREIHDQSPESIGGRLGRKVLSTRHDNYLCAVVCFELLFGCDPLASEKDEEDPTARDRAAAERRYPYLSLVAAGSAPAPEMVVGEAVAGLFVRAFTGPYDQVPSCRDWADALEGLAKAPVERCPMCGSERLRDVADHCPWCEGRFALDRVAAGTFGTDRTRLAPAPSGAVPAAVPPTSGASLAARACWWRVLLAVLLLLTVTSVVASVSTGLGPFVFVGGVLAIMTVCLVRAIVREDG